MYLLGLLYGRKQAGDIFELLKFGHIETFLPLILIL